MIKSEIVACAAAAKTLKKTDTQKAFDGAIETIIQALEHDEKVVISGFGVFESRILPERECINPHTGERLMAQSSRTIVFKPSRSLRKKM